MLLTELNYCRGDREAIKEYLTKYNKEGSELQRKDSLLSWDYEVDMTKENKEKSDNMSGVTAAFAVENMKKASKLLKDAGDDVPKSMIRELKLITRTASSNDTEISKLFSELQSNMTSIYSTTMIRKEIDGETLKFKLTDHLLPIMGDINKESLGNLRWAFRVWHDAVGVKIKPLYEKFVKVANKGAKENGYDDYGDFWRKEYEDEKLEEHMDAILKEMNDLYKKLHAYVRYKLNRMFGNEIVEEGGLIPIHLVSMWGQNWGHLYKIFSPYPNKTIPDVSKVLKDEGWDNVDLVELAESFFVSIGLDKMPESFYDKSMITQPKGKKVVCHPSSWDLAGGDVRLKMPCMSVTQGNLITVHHEMGHIEYYLMYKDQPIEFRTGANPGFHEAVGDTIALSVMIPQHLESIGLLNETAGDKEEEINFLMQQALGKVAFIPFAYIVDKWRWSVFSGNTTPDKYNEHWYDLRKKYQGLTLPKGMKRDNTSLCDAASFFHVAHNTEYLRYFLSHILQYQFHKALCDEAEKPKPYHTCSIHGSKKAGKKLRNMLELGKKLPWKEALEVLTGSQTLSSRPVLDYFQPLENWLDVHRSKNKYPLGWDDN